MFDHVLLSTMAAWNPALLIVIVISKCNHTPESRTYITVNDEQQIKDILWENNDRECCCVPISVATLNDTVNIDIKGPWTNIHINSSLTFNQLNSLTGVKAVKLTLESLRTVENNREKPLRDYRDVVGYRKRVPLKCTFAR